MLGLQNMNSNVINTHLGGILDVGEENSSILLLFPFKIIIRILIRLQL